MHSYFYIYICYVSKYCTIISFFRVLCLGGIHVFRSFQKNNAISSHSNGSIIIAIIRIIKNSMLLGGGREGMDHHLWWCCWCCRDFTFFYDEWRKILYGLFFRIRYLQAVYLNGIINHNLCYGGDFLTNSDDFWFC